MALTLTPEDEQRVRQIVRQELALALQRVRARTARGLELPDGWSTARTFRQPGTRGHVEEIRSPDGCSVIRTRRR